MRNSLLEGFVIFLGNMSVGQPLLLFDPPFIIDPSKVLPKR